VRGIISNRPGLAQRVSACACARIDARGVNDRRARAERPVGRRAGAAAGISRFICFVSAPP
jgi:hypothetical protein